MFYDLSSDQVIVSSGWSSDGTISGVYPLANIDDNQPWNPAQFTANPTRITANFGSAKRVDFVSFIHCNFDASAVVRVQMNAANTWSGPSLSVTVPTDGPTEDGMPSNPYVDLTGVSGYTTGGYQFLSIQLVSGQSSLLSLGLVRLSSHQRVFSDTSTTVRDRSYGATDREVQPIIKRKTDAGTAVGYSRGTRERSVGGTIRCDAGGFADLQTMTRASRGALRPFALVPDPDVNEALFVTWDQDTPLERVYTDLGINDVRVNFVEVGRGLAP